MFNFCRLFISQGHDVTVFCDYLSNKEFKVSENYAEFEKIKIFYSFEGRDFKSKLLKQFATPKLIEKFVNNSSVDVIFSSLAMDRYKSVLKIAKKKNIPIILESCEKYHYSNWPFGRLNPRYYNFSHCWKHEYLKADAVIAISRFIEKYFKEKGRNVVRIPTILDVEKLPCKIDRDVSRSIRYVFSGGLGHGKDSLVEFMIAMNNTKGKLKRSIELNIYGPSKDAVRESLKENAFVMDELGEAVHYHGRIPQNEIPLRLMENDFGIILRPQRESSNAGFPTKIAEYMAAGLSVIANDTGDIGLYLNKSNGFLLENKDVSSVETVILAIDSLAEENLRDKKKCARDTAEMHFDFRVYAKLVSEWINVVARIQ
jgi:glycosyltransferase involved in cell wall biosynthesis